MKFASAALLFVLLLAMSAGAGLHGFAAAPGASMQAHASAPADTRDGAAKCCDPASHEMSVGCPSLACVVTPEYQATRLPRPRETQPVPAGADLASRQPEAPLRPPRAA